MALLLLYIFSSLLIVGPCTAQGETSSSGGVSHISITYGKAAINTISFSSQDDNSNIYVLTNKFASDEGNKEADQINIDTQVEKIKTISGTFHILPLQVTSLSFTTDKDKTYGPFGFPTWILGLPNGIPFSFKVNDEIADWITKFRHWFVSSIISKRPLRPLSVGPWGSQEPGNQWTYEPNGAISKINITHDDAIYSIQFTSQDDSGNSQDSQTFGATTGKSIDEITIDTVNEKLNFISGTYGVKGGYVSVTSLSFSTNSNKTFGPFGTPSGTAFSLQTNESFIGFFGRSGSWLDAIGVYLPRVPEQSLGKWGSQDPGNEWSYVPEGAISHISLTYDTVIHTLNFTSQDAEGNLDNSTTFGWTNGANSSEIDINIEDEKLNSISGTIDKHSGYLSVTSLSFATDKDRVFGPFGTVSGTSFSVRVNDGIIGGFYGRAGSWLDAIGVVVKPTNE